MFQVIRPSRAGLLFLLILFLALFAGIGCGASKEFTAFVRAADGFHRSVAPVVSASLELQHAAATSDGERLAIEVRLDELLDFRRAIEAAKQRVGADW